MNIEVRLLLTILRHVIERHNRKLIKLDDVSLELFRLASKIEKTHDLNDFHKLMHKVDKLMAS
jgi:hypothetical protein